MGLFYSDSEFGALLCGFSAADLALLHEIANHWSTYVVEHDQAWLAEMRSQLPDVNFIAGDACGIRVWQDLDLAGLGCILLAYAEQQYSLEVCRLVREILKLDLPIVVLRWDDAQPFESYGVMLIDPAVTAFRLLGSRVSGCSMHVLETLRERGQVVEYQVAAKSPFTDREVSSLKQDGWRLAAIQRDSEMIVPDGSSTIRVGDRIVLVGESSVLNGLANIFLEGVPQFPLQFGANLALALHTERPHLLDEAIYLHDHMRSTAMIFYPYRSHIDKTVLERVKHENVMLLREVSSTLQMVQSVEDIGLYVLSDQRHRLMGRHKLKQIFRQCRRPFLLARGSFPYGEVVVSLNCNNPVSVIEPAIEICKLLHVKLKAVFVTPPPELQIEQDVDDFVRRSELVADFSKIHDAEIEYVTMAGNPVLETLRLLEAPALLVVGYAQMESLSYFRPSVPFLLASRAAISTLVLVADG